MTDTTLQQAAPAAGATGKLAWKIFLWILVLLVLGAGWFMLLARVAPARLDFSSVGAMLMASAPPFLLTLLFWTGIQRFSLPPPVAALPPSPIEAVASAAATGPVARFRIGAWSALTPHGNAIETLEGTKARTKVFNPDKAIEHPSGYPVHAAIIGTLDLASMGHASTARQRAPRVMTMLRTVLDDLHAQQDTLTDTIEGPANVYWMMPPALHQDDDSHGALFAAAWKRSAWRDSAYMLHVIPAGEASVFSVLSVLQEGIDKSSIPYTILVAADSLLDSEELAPALARAQVFSHTAPQGFIPSEGAAGLLLFNPVKSSDELWSNACIMGPVAAGSDDAVGEGLRAIMSGALAASGKGATDVHAVVSDCDHRTRGRMEVIGAMGRVLSTLDPLEQRISPMEYAGAFGAAADLVNLALGAELAGENSALVVGTGRDQHAALVLSPA